MAASSMKESLMAMLSTAGCCGSKIHRVRSGSRRGQREVKRRERGGE